MKTENSYGVSLETVRRKCNEIWGNDLNKGLRGSWNSKNSFLVSHQNCFDTLTFEGKSLIMWKIDCYPSAMIDYLRHESLNYSSQLVKGFEFWKTSVTFSRWIGQKISLELRYENIFQPICSARQSSEFMKFKYELVVNIKLLIQFMNSEFQMHHSWHRVQKIELICICKRCARSLSSR